MSLRSEGTGEPDKSEPGKWVLEVEALVKRYSERIVLHGVGLKVGPGEIHGLLGPNGAGKTTTLECIEGLRRPDGGRVQFQGAPVRQGRVPKAMGVQLQLSGLPGTMTVAEAIRFVGAYRRAASPGELLERLGLGPLKDRQYQALSVGQQRRLHLALAVVHRPAMVILDEPTAGLDVSTRAELHGILKELRSEGTAVLLATHDMAEAETLTDRLTIVIDGRVVASGTSRELTAQGSGRTRISVSTVHGRIANDPALPGATVQATQDGYVVYRSEDTSATVSALLAKVARLGDGLVDLRVERPSLEERFLELVRKEAA